TRLCATRARRCKQKMISPGSAFEEECALALVTHLTSVRLSECAQTESRFRPVLGPYRVLDLTDHRGELGPKLLADLGADVIRIEPPGGCAARRRGPRPDRVPEPEASLQFFAHNRNKRSIVLDLARAPDREAFLRLVASADFLFEASPPGALEPFGLGFDALRAVNPQIVHVQVTP